MTSWLYAALVPIILFLFGSIPFGYLVGRWNGIDIRTMGSGNIGATNVGRVLGRKWYVVVFAGDFFKGYLPLMAIYYFSALSVYRYLDGQPILEQVVPVLGAVAAILGHNYTPWLGGKGGKGIATSAGVLMAIIPWVLMVAWILWFVVVWGSRYISVASVAASLVLPFACFFIYPGQWANLGLATAACFLGVWRHRSNLQRIYDGTEPKVDKPHDKKPDNPDDKK